MNEGMLTVSLGDHSYDIFFGAGACSRFRDWVSRFYGDSSVFVVTDRTVAAIYGDDLRTGLSGVPYDVLSLPPGEEAKHAGTVREIYSFLARGGAGRNSVVAAFGGGVVGDLAGFAAATFQRGLPVVQIPTTLVSQADSSVGGKTGYNLPEGKNLVGAFHQPRSVFIDPTFLLTLDRRNLRAGLAEVVKCAFAGEPSLVGLLEASAGSWQDMAGDAWIPLIRGAVAFKASVVERDERETSARRVLNLGHTIGHALEQATGYRCFLHGEAVAMGLAWEAVFSRRQGVTPPEVERRLIALLLALGFPLDEPGVADGAIADAFGMDKKKVVSDIDMPLVTGPGSCVLKRVPLGVLRDALPEVRAEVGRIVREFARPDEEAAAAKPVELPPDAPPAPVDAGLPIPVLERMVVEDPRNVDAMIALSEAYRGAGNVTGAWETIKEALHLDPASERAQNAARELERAVRDASPPVREKESPLLEDVVILDEGAFELRSAEDRSGSRGATEDESPDSRDALPGSSAPDAGTPVRTVTLASIFWDQGRQEEARRIVGEILRENPEDLRALAWLKEHPDRKPKDSAPERSVLALTVFLETLGKEYGHDVPRHD